MTRRIVRFTAKAPRAPGWYILRHRSRDERDEVLHHLSQLGDLWVRTNLSGEAALTWNRLAYAGWQRSVKPLPYGLVRNLIAEEVKPCRARS